MYNTKESVKGMLLENEWESVYNAHRWISFSPEKRATQIVTEFSQMLQEDLEKLGENTGKYQEKFLTHFRAWISAKSNCASSAITGGSNFNVRRAEKANNREHARMEDFWKFREKYFKAVNRQRTLSPEEELDQAQERLDKITNKQQMMKEMNVILRKIWKDKEITTEEDRIKKAVETLQAEEYPDQLIAELGTYARVGREFAFPSYALTNNNATIKRTQEKIAVMKVRIERKETFEDIKFDGGYLTIEDDRVKIYHDSKPDQKIIEEIKKSGFRWSPFWKCWCRKHTGNAIYVAKKLSFIQEASK